MEDTLVNHDDWHALQPDYMYRPTSTLGMSAVLWKCWPQNHLKKSLVSQKQLKYDTKYSL